MITQNEIGSGPTSGNFAITGSNPDRSKLCRKCLGRYPAEFNVCPKDATPLEQAPDEGDPLLGAILGNTYQIKRVLGEGAHARRDVTVGDDAHAEALVVDHREKADVELAHHAGGVVRRRGPRHAVNGSTHHLAAAQRGSSG